MRQDRGPLASASASALYVFGASCAVATGAMGCGSPTVMDDASVPPIDAPGTPPDAFEATPVDAYAPPGTDAWAPDAFAPGEDFAISPTTTQNTGTSGEIDVPVTITDQRSFMVVATSENASRLSVLSVTDPSGDVVLRWEDWYSGDNSYTSAIFAERTATTINWPIHAEDPALVPGTYVVRLGSYRVDGITSRPDVNVDVTTITNRDADLATGALHVVVVWAAGMADDAALVTATEAAVDHWNDVWSMAGLSVEVRYVESTIDPDLPYPSAMTGDLLDMASSFVEPGEIAVIVGETINDDTSQYGVAGRIPGPVIRSPISAIVVGWLANAGGDGTFSDNDIQLYGEVLAHEVGHFVGLFHPVENAFDRWDSLRDTPECRNASNCEAMLGTNLMFPYSICDADGCVSTTILTNDQRGVMHRYTGTR